MAIWWSSWRDTPGANVCSTCNASTSRIRLALILGVGGIKAELPRSPPLRTRVSHTTKGSGGRQTFSYPSEISSLACP
ncbi:cytochrome p450 [Moniliophthora roreri]|nr:cytochrome p450 [Moniliophthora roreri]